MVPPESQLKKLATAHRCAFANPSAHVSIVLRRNRKTAFATMYWTAGQGWTVQGDEEAARPEELPLDIAGRSRRNCGDRGQFDRRSSA